MKKLRRNFAMAAVGFILLAASGCGFVPSRDPEPSNPGISAREPVVVTTYNSDNQLEEETFETTPQRVIAIWQGPIETLLALGVGDKIIAATGIPEPDYIKPEYRVAYAKIPYTSFNTIPREEALLKNPDFIVTSWGSAFTNKSIGTTDYWQERGVKTYIQEIPPAIGGMRTVENEYKFILDMGKIFRVEDRAEKLVNQMEEQIDRVQKESQSQGLHPTVMIVQYMGSRLVNWGDQYLQADIVKKLNGQIVLHEKGYISQEELIAKDPDVIFLMVNEWDNKHEEDVLRRFREDISLNSLKAIHENKVYLLPLNEGQYSAVRLKDGIDRMARAMYPELNFD